MIVRSTPIHKPRNITSGTIPTFIVANRVNTTVKSVNKIEYSNRVTLLMNKNEIDQVMITGLEERLKIALSLLSKEKRLEYDLKISKSVQ